MINAINSLKPSSLPGSHLSEAEYSVVQANAITSPGLHNRFVLPDSRIDPSLRLDCPVRVVKVSLFESAHPRSPFEQRRFRSSLLKNQPIYRFLNGVHLVIDRLYAPVGYHRGLISKNKLFLFWNVNSFSFSGPSIEIRIMPRWVSGWLPPVLGDEVLSIVQS